MIIMILVPYDLPCPGGSQVARKWLASGVITQIGDVPSHTCHSFRLGIQ